MLKKQPPPQKQQDKPNPNKTNSPQQIDPQDITEKKKTADLEALNSGQKRTQIRTGTPNKRPQQNQEIDRSALLQTLSNPFRDS